MSDPVTRLKRWALYCREAAKDAPYEPWHLERAQTAVGVLNHIESLQSQFAAAKAVLHKIANADRKTYGSDFNMRIALQDIAHEGLEELK